jgi:hypothetical protein
MSNENPSHLLIPIEDIERIINSPYTHFKVAAVLKNLTATCKRISLSEEDIENKAVEIFPNSNDIFGKIAYKQALKDLLNK